MTREEQYWEDTQEALSRIFDRCEEIEPQSGYEMYEDIQFIRGFINKHRPKAEEQESFLDKIRTEIEFEVDHRTNMLCAEDVFAILDNYKAESEPQENEDKG